MDKNSEKLSALMDSELHQSNECLDQLSGDAELRDVWQRYHLARDAIKGQLSNQPFMDISANVSEALKAEAVIFTPIWRRLSPRFIMKQTAGLAVAAAVATVAVLSVQQAQLPESNITSIASANTQQVINQDNLQAGLQQGSQLRQVSFTTRQKLDAAVESKLSSYLVNHNEFSKSVRVSGVMPYSRIVSFVPSSNSQQVNNDK